MCVCMFSAANKNEGRNYIDIMKSLQIRERYGVIVNNKKIKDMYIVPIPDSEAYPAELIGTGFEGGPGIEAYTKGRKQKLLLGICIRHQEKLLMNSNPNSPLPYSNSPRTNGQNSRPMDPRRAGKPNLYPAAAAQEPKLKLYQPKIVFQGTPPGSPRRQPPAYVPGPRPVLTHEQKAESMFKLLNANSHEEDEPASTNGGNLTDPMATATAIANNSSTVMTPNRGMIGSRQNSMSNANHSFNQSSQMDDTDYAAPPTPDPYNNENEEPPSVPQSPTGQDEDPFAKQKSTDSQNNLSSFEPGFDKTQKTQLNFSLLSSLLSDIKARTEPEPASYNAPPLSHNPQEPENNGFKSLDINEFLNPGYLNPDSMLPPEILHQQELEKQKLDAEKRLQEELAKQREEMQKQILAQRPVDKDQEITTDNTWAVMDDEDDIAAPAIPTTVPTTLPTTLPSTVTTSLPTSVSPATIPQTQTNPMMDPNLMALNAALAAGGNTADFMKNVPVINSANMLQANAQAGNLPNPANLPPVPIIPAADFLAKTQNPTAKVSPPVDNLRAGATDLPPPNFAVTQAKPNSGFGGNTSRFKDYKSKSNIGLLDAPPVTQNYDHNSYNQYSKNQQNYNQPPARGRFNPIKTGYVPRGGGHHHPPPAQPRNTYQHHQGRGGGYQPRPPKNFSSYNDWQDKGSSHKNYNKYDDSSNPNPNSNYDGFGNKPVSRNTSPTNLAQHPPRGIEPPTVEPTPEITTPESHSHSQENQPSIQSPMQDPTAHLPEETPSQNEAFGNAFEHENPADSASNLNQNSQFQPKNLLPNEDADDGWSDDEGDKNHPGTNNEITMTPPIEA